MKRQKEKLGFTIDRPASVFDRVALDSFYSFFRNETEPLILRSFLREANIDCQDSRLSDCIYYSEYIRTTHYCIYRSIYCNAFFKKVREAKSTYVHYLRNYGTGTKSQCLTHSTRLTSFRNYQSDQSARVASWRHQENPFVLSQQEMRAMRFMLASFLLV